MRRGILPSTENHYSDSGSLKRKNQQGKLRLNKFIVKTIKQVEFIRIEEVIHVPDKLEERVLYVSQEFKMSIHLCLCGCGKETILPFYKEVNGINRGWTHDKDEQGGYTLRPSIGNFSGENPYHAHYIITKNKANFV